MAEEQRVDHDGGMLARLSNEIVGAQKKYFGLGPTSAKSYMLDDLLFVVMRGGMTTAEKTMLDFDRQDLVREFRQAFENEMTSRMTGIVEDITGRKVVTYQSQVMFDPDIVVEMFVFDQRASGAARGATAQGQLGDDSAGEATDEDALDEPASGGE